MASSRAVPLVCLVLAAVLVASPHVEAAITCGQVSSALAQCIPYLQKKVPVQQPPPGCCKGIKDLNAAAKTTPDRQTACGCLKSAAAALKGIDYGLAGGLPAKCGTNIPYKIAPSTDCSKVK